MPARAEARRPPMNADGSPGLGVPRRRVSLGPRLHVGVHHAVMIAATSWATRAATSQSTAEAQVGWAVGASPAWVIPRLRRGSRPCPVTSAGSSIWPGSGVAVRAVRRGQRSRGGRPAGSGRRDAESRKAESRPSERLSRMRWRGLEPPRPNRVTRPSTLRVYQFRHQRALATRESRAETRARSRSR